MFIKTHTYMAHKIINKNLSCNNLNYIIAKLQVI